MCFFSEVKANRLKIRVLSADGSPISLEKSLFSLPSLHPYCAVCQRLAQGGWRGEGKKRKAAEAQVCAYARVRTWERLHPPESGGMPEQDRGRSPRAKKSGSNETTPAVPKWERRGLLG